MGREGSGVTPSAGKIQVSFTFQGKRCRETVDLPWSIANKKATENSLKQYKKDIANGIFDYAETFPNSLKVKRGLIKSTNKSTTVREFFNQWITSLTHEQRTIKNYRSSMQTILGWFGDEELKSILPIDIQNKFNASGLGVKTVKNYNSVFSTMFEAAIANSFCVKNPCSSVAIPKQKTPKETIKIYENEEVVKILKHFKEQCEQRHNMILFMFETGLRPSECCTLTWDDLDLVAKTANVDKALDIDGTLKKPKNDNSRAVDLTIKAIQAIESQRTFTKNKKHGLVFVNNLTKNRWDMTKFLRRIWYPALKKLEISRRTVYNIRHTFGSVLISTPGLSVKYVSTQLGHANTTTTEKHYARWMISSNAAMLAIRNAA